MKKILQLFTLCLLSLQLSAFNDGASLTMVDSTCSVSIEMDSVMNDVVLTALSDGEGPFTYLWSTGETTPTITVTSWNTNFCVTITDASGCVAENCLWNNPPSCSVIVGANPGGGLTAITSGTAPFTYLWATGETTQSILPATSGNYCVTITSDDGCEATDCGTFSSGGSSDSCEVTIELDTTGLGLVLTAQPVGVGPFTYQWNVQNWQTQAIQIPGPGPNYCVTVTAADGCEVSTCFDFGSNDCEVNIYEGDSLGITILDAIITPFVGPFTYTWSTGATTQYIEPTDAGTYCVTITTGSGCTATDCYAYDPLAGLQISGYVYLEDSLNATFWDGYAELYEVDAVGGTYTLTATVEVESDPSGYYSYYDFGAVAAGTYIVKAGIDPADPIADDYLPTYYGNVLEWDEATVITKPSNQSLYNITLDDGEMLMGDGTIDGLVTEGDGLKPNDDANRSPGDPLEGVSVLLFDVTENSITHTLTDVDGEYSFGDLPWGTYKLMVEIVGVEQGIRWVTIGEDEPNASGIDFEVNENEVVNGIAELVNDQDFSVYPNPASSQVILSMNSAGAFEAQLKLTSLTGATIFAQQKSVVKGEQQFEVQLGDLPIGVYFLQMTTGNEVISRKLIIE